MLCAAGNMLRRIRERGRGGGSTQVIISAAKTVISKVKSVSSGSTVQSRGNSYAAAVPSNMPKAPKPHKRISKDERHSMVESYVNKYRESHAGKFPTASEARRNVGGSYYTVRKILQELQFKSKLPSSHGEKEMLLGKEFSKECESLSEVEHVSTVGVAVDGQIRNDSQAVVVSGVVEDNRHQDVEGSLQTCQEDVVAATAAEARPSLATSEDGLLEAESEDVPPLSAGKYVDDIPQKAEDDHSASLAVDSHQVSREINDESLDILEDSKMGEAEDSCPHFAATESDWQNSETKDGQPGRPASKELTDTDVPKKNDNSHETDKYSQDISSEQNNDAEPSEKPTLWENLKSFASGIINVWKKL